MITARCQPGVVTGVDGRIYAIGGRSSGVSLSAVERLDTASGTWSSVASLNVARYSPGTAVGPDGRIYAIGGYDQATGANLNSIEVYDAAADSWTLIQMSSGSPAPGGYAAVTGLDGNIYAYGLKPASGRAMFDGMSWMPLDATLGVGFHSAVTGSDGTQYVLDVGAGKTGNTKTAAFDATGWATGVPPLLDFRVNGGAAAAEGQVWMIGGYRALGGLMTAAEALGPLPAPLFENATAWWSFQGASPASDSVGGAVGTLMGSPIFGSGRVGKALWLNGTSQYLKVVPSPAIELGSGSLTIETWVWWIPSGAMATVLDKRAYQEGKYRGYHFFILNDGRFGLQLANGATYQNYVSKAKLKANRWTHVAVTVERSAAKSEGTLYIDSVVDSTFVPLAGDVTSSAALNIGRHSFSGLPLKGRLDELTMYRRALRWAEIRAVFLAGKEGKAIQ